MNDQEYALALDYDNSFSQSDAPEVIKNFVCGVCHGPLTEVYSPSEARVLVVCLEHGNVCFCGRVTVATVSIELERSYKKYYSAIRALPELWGELVDHGFDRDHSFKIIKEYVCSVCGSKLFPYTRKQDSNVDIHCTAHGNINTCGYIKKVNFTYDYNKIKSWEKEHKSKQGV